MAPPADDEGGTPSAVKKGALAGGDGVKADGTAVTRSTSLASTLPVSGMSETESIRPALSTRSMSGVTTDAGSPTRSTSLKSVAPPGDVVEDKEVACERNASKLT